MNNALEWFVLWTLKNYGSDAGEKAEPGSKAKAQAAHIARFAAEMESVNAFIRQNDYDLVVTAPAFAKLTPID